LIVKVSERVTLIAVLAEQLCEFIHVQGLNAQYVETCAEYLLLGRLADLRTQIRECMSPIKYLSKLSFREMAELLSHNRGYLRLLNHIFCLVVQMRIIIHGARLEDVLLRDLS
jgi:hypothetical protein